MEMLMTYISQPHKGTIYVLELARKSSRKLVASAMPAAPVAADDPIPLRRVPLFIIEHRDPMAGVITHSVKRADYKPRAHDVVLARRNSDGEYVAR